MHFGLQKGALQATKREEAVRRRSEGTRMERCFSHWIQIEGKEGR